MKPTLLSSSLQTQELNGESYRYSFATREDLSDIVTLHTSVFTNRNPLKLFARYEWKMFRYPGGPSSVLLARSSNDTLAGMYGSIPLFYYQSGNSVMFQLVFASAVHPDHRRKGLFSSIYRTYRQYALEQFDAPTLIGSPNQLAYAINTRKFGHSSPHRLNTYILSGDCLQVTQPLNTTSYLSHAYPRALRKMLNLLPQPRRFSPVIKNSPIIIHAHSDIPEDYAPLWEMIKHNHAFIADRSHDVMRWRFFEEPYSKNLLLMFYLNSQSIGFAVISGHTHITIKDLVLCDTQQHAECVLNALFAYLECNYKFAQIRFPILNDTIETALTRFSPRLENRSVFGIYPLKGEREDLAVLSFAQLSPSISGFSFLIG